MNAANVIEVCRLCPSSIGLLNVFDEIISFKYNIRDVILVNTGIEVLQTDIVSKKICQKCCKILHKTYEFRLDARKHDRELKEKSGQHHGDGCIRLPNTSVTIKKNATDSCLSKVKVKIEPGNVPPATQKGDDPKRIHPSVADVFRNYPRFKLPKKCIERHIAPVVALTMGEVETYFKKRKLNMKKFIYKQRTKTSVSRTVAKKKTTFPAKEKTVAPLKISRKLLENPDASELSSDTGYIRLSVPDEAKGRKRKISSSSDKSVQSKLSRNNQLSSLSVSKSNTDTPKTANNNVAVTLQAVFNSSTNISETSKLHNSSNDIPETSQQVKTPTPSLIDPLSENSRTPSPASADPISEDSRDSCSTNISTATSSTTKKPQFMKSFGLTPTVTTTKSHTLLVCNLCGSIHHNAIELKRHTSKHMVCQFCKRKFKSVESKQNHVDHSCIIKKVMISPGPIVSLEKIHLKVDIRKKYRNAFTSFELIPGLQEPTPVEEVILKASSPPPDVAEDAVIVLSDDDDEAAAKSTDPLSGIPTPSASMPPPAFEDVVYNTVSIVRPDIRVKNNMILNNLVENMTDKQLMKDLIQLFKPKQLETAETMLQTDLPASKDIKIHNSEGTCEFVNLKGQLTTYKVPVTISNGSFHVNYQFRDNSTTNKCLALWDNMPVIDVCKETASRLSDQSKNVLKHSNTNGIMSLPKTSEVPLLEAAVSSTRVMQNGTTFSLPSSTIIQTVPVGTTSNTVSVQQTVPIPATNIIPSNTSNSATPLLQNYALSMTSAPIISNPIPIPRTYIDSALSNTVSTSNRTASSAAGSNIAPKTASSITISYNQSLPSSFVMARPGPDVAPSSSLVAVQLNAPYSNLYSTNTTFIPTTNTNALKSFNNSSVPSSDNTSISIPPVQETSKFRVKSVWELQ